jgi:hypothetical protein
MTSSEESRFGWDRVLEMVDGRKERYNIVGIHTMQ